MKKIVTGTISAKDSVEIGFRLGGRVVDVFVQEGDLVHVGQPLARTDPLQQEQTLRVAQAAVESALAAEAQARQAQLRAAAMLERGVGTRAGLDSANLTLSATTGALTQAKDWTLCKAIRQHGAEAFVVEVLEKVRGKAEAHQREREVTKQVGATLNTA